MLPRKKSKNTGCLGHREHFLKKAKYSDKEHGNNLLRYPFPLRLTSPRQIERTLTRWTNTFHDRTIQ